MKRLNNLLKRSVTVSSVLLGIIAGLISTSQTAFAAEFLVKYRSAYGLMNFNDTKNYQVMDYHTTGQLMKVHIPERLKLQAMLDLYSNPNVQYVVPNAKMKAFMAPVDTQALKQQWAIAKVQAEKAWQRAGNRGSKKVLLAVIDTGVDYKHRSLAPNMVNGYDFARNDDDPMDQTSFQNPGHGTHCAGIVGATGLADDGTIGLSPEVSMMPLRFLDENGSGDLNNGVKAIDYAVQKGVKVISASWGATVPRSEAIPLIEAIERAEKAGVVFVVAAANDGKNNDRTEVYPANAGLSNTISVAASNSGDQKPSWSNYGRAKVHVASPGAGILSTLPSNKYGNLDGTSMATPLVAGLVALVMAQDENLTPLQIRSLIQATGAKVAIETACDCRIDAFGAVDTILSKKMFVSPYAGTYAVGDKVTFEGVYGKAPFTFETSNATVGAIDASGVLTTVAEGETQITVKDSAGVVAQSYKIFVGKPSSGGGGNPPDDGGGGGGGAPGECPIGDPQICQIICGIQPDLPFCQK